MTPRNNFWDKCQSFDKMRSNWSIRNPSGEITHSCSLNDLMNLMLAMCGNVIFLNVFLKQIHMTPRNLL